MYQDINCQPSRYYCKCQNTYISANLLSNHLQLPCDHIICRVDLQKPSSEYFNKSILNKIDSILKIQTQIQKSSINLTKVIMINTTLAINKLDNLVRLYRNILSNPQEIVDSQDTEIVSTFIVEKSINQALIDHFKQEIIAEKLTADRKKEIINSKILDLFTKKSSNFSCMALFNNENFIATGGCDGFIRIWDTKSNTQCYCSRKHKGSVSSLAIGLGDNILLSGSHDCSVRLWDLNLLKQIYKFKEHSDAVSSVLISKNNKIGLSGDYIGLIKIWNLEKKVVKSTFTVMGFVNQVFLIKDEKSLAVVGNKGVSFWNLSNKSEELVIPEKNTCAIAFSKDENFFIIGDKEGAIQIWISKTHKMIFKDRKHSQEINMIAFSHDSLIFATCSSDKKVLIWDFTSKNIKHTLNYNCSIQSILFFKDSETLIICTLLTEIYYYKPKSNPNKKIINPKMLNYFQITLSIDLIFMAYGYSKITLFDLEKETKISKYSHMKSVCNILKFTQENNYLGCGQVSGEVLVLKIPSLIQVYKLNLGNSNVVCLSFSANTKFVASAYKEGEMFVQLIENREVVYKKDNLIVKSIVFCLNSEKLIYSNDKSIVIVDKHFKKAEIIKIDNFSNFLFLSKDDKTVIASDQYLKLSKIDISNGKIFFDNQRDIKKKNSKDQRFHLFLLWQGINLS